MDNLRGEDCCYNPRPSLMFPRREVDRPSHGQADDGRVCHFRHEHVHGSARQESNLQRPVFDWQKDPMPRPPTTTRIARRGAPKKGNLPHHKNHTTSPQQATSTACPAEPRPWVPTETEPTSRHGLPTAPAKSSCLTSSSNDSEKTAPTSYSMKMQRHYRFQKIPNGSIRQE